MFLRLAPHGFLSWFFVWKPAWPTNLLTNVFPVALSKAIYIDISRPVMVPRASINLFSCMDQFVYVPVMLLVLDLCTQPFKDWYDLSYVASF